MVIDPIGDMLTRVRNAGMVGKTKGLVPYSKMKNEIAKVLVSEGFLRSYEATEEEGSKNGTLKFLELGIAYKGADDQTGKRTPKIGKSWRVSKVSKRIYSGAKELKPVRQGFGRAILSTTKGIMSDKNAKKQKLGGEVLFKIW